jgi:hypothetical protein
VPSGWERHQLQVACPHARRRSDSRISVAERAHPPDRKHHLAGAGRPVDLDQLLEPALDDDTVTQTQPAYDANGDERLWVRGQAMVRGKRRTLVKLVRVDNVTEEIPCNAILAGSSPRQKTATR